MCGKGGQGGSRRERSSGAGKESFTIKKVVVCSSNIGGFCCDDNNCDYW